MRPLFVLLFPMLFLPLSLAAQPGGASPLLLSLEGTGGVGLYRDMGAGPLILKGPELAGGARVEQSLAQWRWDAGLGLHVGTYGYSFRLSSLFTYGGQLSAHCELLRRAYRGRGWTLWAGVRVDDLFDIRYNPQHNNSSVGMSNFIRLRLSGRCEYRWARWMAYLQAWADPLALMLRPGFSYVNNYDRDVSNPVACAFDQYQWYLAGCTGLATQVGVRRSLSSGNEVGLAYCWQYLTSRVSADGLKAPWRFQQASHGLTFQLIFNL